MLLTPGSTMSDQSKNACQFAMFGIVTHYDRIKWKQANKLTWVVSATLQSTTLNFWWTHLRSRSLKVTRSKSVQTEKFGNGWCDACFRSVFRQDAKMTVEHFLNGPNGTKFKNRENMEIPGNGVKLTIFDLKISILGHFPRCLHDILYTYTPFSVLSCFS